MTEVCPFYVCRAHWGDSHLQSSTKQDSEVSRLQQALDDALESRERDARRTDTDVRRITDLQERVVALESELENGGVTVRKWSIDALVLSHIFPA